MKINNNGFTLIEILVGVLIVGIIMIGAFQSLSAIGIGKIRLIQETSLEKDSVYFTEKLFEMIKRGGTIDYEEYFNRKVVGLTTGSGHYNKRTGFGNFGSGGQLNNNNDYGDNFYFCRSGSGKTENMSSGAVNPTGGCYDNDLNNYSASVIGKFQRYGQYSFQFIDYNSDFDSDYGDQDGDGKIIGDLDDEYLGEGPNVFTGGLDVKELYLISGDKKNRTYFRWNIGLDPNAPSGSTCTNTTGTGCIGTIEFLKLEGRDWGYNHNKSKYDGVIDTWIYDKDFTGGREIVAGTGSSDFWQPLFSDDINVVDFKIFVYPNIDNKLAWKNDNLEVNISPYIRLQLIIEPSWKIKKTLRGDIMRIKISNTISLSEIYSE